VHESREGAEEATPDASAEPEIRSVSDNASEEEISPFGPLVAEAAEYTEATKAAGIKPAGAPYQGYYFRILTRQGANAAGGAYDYVINGNMVAGFAMIAFPADYGASGIMTFVVNENGKVYQKDLGKKTAEIAGAMTAYDPDATWTVVNEAIGPYSWAR